MLRRQLRPGLLLAFLLAGAAWWLLPAANSAPDVQFTTISGKKISLQALRGKPVLVTFWATDCPGCIKEIPHLISLYRQFHERGLEIIAVAMYYDPPNHVVEMARVRRLPYDIALDLRGSHARAFGNVQLTPSTFLISPQGSIVAQITGAFDFRQMQDSIDNML